MSITGRSQGCLSQPGIAPGQSAQAAPALFHSAAHGSKSLRGNGIEGLFRAPFRRNQIPPSSTSRGCRLVPPAPAPGFQSRHGLPAIQAAIALQIPARGKTPGHRTERQGRVSLRVGAGYTPTLDAPGSPGTPDGVLHPRALRNDPRQPNIVAHPSRKQGVSSETSPGSAFRPAKLRVASFLRCSFPQCFPRVAIGPGKHSGKTHPPARNRYADPPAGSLFPSHLRRTPGLLARPAPGKGPLRGSIPRNEGALSIGSPGGKRERRLPPPGPGASHLMVLLPFSRIDSVHRSVFFYSPFPIATAH